MNNRIVYERDPSSGTPARETKNWAVVHRITANLPCDSCPLRESCAETGTSCLAFRKWAISGRVQPEHKIGWDLK